MYFFGRMSIRAIGVILLRSFLSTKREKLKYLNLISVSSNGAFVAKLIGIQDTICCNIRCQSKVI